MSCMQLIEIWFLLVLKDKDLQNIFEKLIFFENQINGMIQKTNFKIWAYLGNSDFEKRMKSYFSLSTRENFQKKNNSNLTFNELLT